MVNVVLNYLYYIAMPKIIYLGSNRTISVSNTLKVLVCKQMNSGLFKNITNNISIKGHMYKQDLAHSVVDMPVV